LPFVPLAENRSDHWGSSDYAVLHRDWLLLVLRIQKKKKLKKKMVLCDLSRYLQLCWASDL
jgi:hypothetical protein